MKSFKENKKGFTLVELVIVVAILGVLASVSINMFSGIAVRSRRNADRLQAENIKSAITAYLSETGNVSLDALLEEGHGGSEPSGEQEQADAIIVGLQKTVTIGGNTVGPYLDSFGNPSVEHYAPQEDTMSGWLIKYDESTGAVLVQSHNDENRFEEGPIITGGGSED